jgi:hypothetical protein
MTTAHNQYSAEPFFPDRSWSLLILLLVLRLTANDLRCPLQPFSTDHAQKTH